jgi:NADH-quinone oxidoreductase subunit I
MIKAIEYFLEIIRGSVITARHFCNNMFFHTLKVFGIRTKRKGSVTIQYPEQRRKIPSRHRSLHRLMKNDNGEPRCVVCMLCATVCPSECIYIEPEEISDPEIQKRPKAFIIDISRCCFCGFCVEACPEDAIRMDTKKHDFGTYSRENLVYDLNKLLS